MKRASESFTHKNMIIASSNKFRLFELPSLLDFQFSQRHNPNKFGLCSFSLTE